MGCISHKSTKPLLVLPNFRATKKEINREDELNHIDQIFTESQQEYVKLSLESNNFRSKRLSLKENQNSDDLIRKT